MIYCLLFESHNAGNWAHRIRHQFQALLLPKSVTTDFEGFSDRQHFSDVNGSILRQECLNFSSTLSL
ncbi:unnamed protein product [Acanthoscelides obtectus]|uniref:Uncharacterized protein n=1 Tax=Acanthoscelides obtectus TaxID=200917 RepID=A0A9P0JUV6_ACAOB|nr:unnamed protein product [Acanthoscelides obtectus]CAK1640735.1 hypothetical protein AOBTE_LOCUS11898 [Acanthoscelides obtectus]